jgi:hypothetical protein
VQSKNIFLAIFREIVVCFSINNKKTRAKDRLKADIGKKVFA